MISAPRDFNKFMVAFPSFTKMSRSHVMICYCCKWCVFVLISYIFFDFTTALHFGVLQEQENSKQNLFFFRKMVIFHRIFPSIIVQIATSKKYSNSHKFYQKHWFNLIHEGSIIMSIWISHILLIWMCILLFWFSFWHEFWFI